MAVMDRDELWEVECQWPPAVESNGRFTAVLRGDGRRSLRQSKARVCGFKPRLLSLVSLGRGEGSDLGGKAAYYHYYYWC